MSDDKGSGEAIRKRLVASLRRDLECWRAGAEAWDTHHGTCPLCGAVKTGADRQCTAGRRLRREAKDAKRAADLSGEDIVHVLGKDAAEAIAREVFAAVKP